MKFNASINNKLGRGSGSAALAHQHYQQDMLVCDATGQGDTWRTFMACMT